MSVSTDRKKLLHVPRITQIDSKYLDYEVFILLKEVLSRAFAYNGQNILVGLEPEFEAALKAYLHHFTLEKCNQTIGQQLLQVKYAGKIASLKVKWYYLSLILGPWLKLRIHFFINFIKRNDVKLFFRNLTDTLETVYTLVDIMNLLWFLIKGEYLSLTERLLGLRVVPSTQESIRKISYAYFTRELLWNGFADLLATILPLIPARRFHNYISQFLPSCSKHIANKQENTNISNIKTICAVCNNLAILPHKFGCIHVACYYCIYSALGTSLYRCPVCGIKVDHPSQITPLTIR